MRDSWIYNCTLVRCCSSLASANSWNRHCAFLACPTYTHKSSRRPDEGSRESSSVHYTPFGETRAPYGFYDFRQMTFSRTNATRYNIQTRHTNIQKRVCWGSPGLLNRRKIHSGIPFHYPQSKKLPQMSINFSSIFVLPGKNANRHIRLLQGSKFMERFHETLRYDCNSDALIHFVEVIFMTNFLQKWDKKRFLISWWTLRWFGGVWPSPKRMQSIFRIVNGSQNTDRKNNFLQIFKFEGKFVTRRLEKPLIIFSHIFAVKSRLIGWLISRN